MQVVADASPFVATIMANQTAVHAIPAAINRLTETLLASVGAADAHVRVVNSPMPVVPGEQGVQLQEAAGDPFIVSVCRAHLPLCAGSRLIRF